MPDNEQKVATLHYVKWQLLLYALSTETATGNILCIY